MMLGKPCLKMLRISKSMDILEMWVTFHGTKLKVIGRMNMPSI